MNAIRPDAVSFSVCFAFDEANEAVTNAIRMLAADENVSEALLYCPDGAFDKPVNLWRGGDKIALVSAPKKNGKKPSLPVVYNKLAHSASADHIIFIDQYSCVSDDFVSQAAQEMQSECGVIFPTYRDDAAKIFDTPDVFLLCRGLGLRKDGAVAKMLSRREPNPYAAELRERSYPSLCTLIMPTHVFHNLGGFDEKLPHAFVEDFCLQAATSGVALRQSEILVCDAPLSHAGDASLKERKRIFNKHFDGLYRTGVLTAGIWWMRLKHAIFRKSARRAAAR